MAEMNQEQLSVEPTPLPAENGAPIAEGGGESKAAMEQQVQQILEQLPPEIIQSVASMEAEEAMDILIELFETEVGMDSKDATMMARLLYTEILSLAQEQGNVTIDELQGEGPPPIDVPSSPETPPAPSVGGGGLESVY